MNLRKQKFLSFILNASKVINQSSRADTANVSIDQLDEGGIGMSWGNIRIAKNLIQRCQINGSSKSCSMIFVVSSKSFKSSAVIRNRREERKSLKWLDMF